MVEALSYDFIQHAIVAGILVSIVAGIIGSLIVVNNMLFLAGGIAHAAYGGVGIAIFFSLPIFLTTSIFSLLVAVVLAFVTLENKSRSDSFIGFIWAFGMALGILLIDLTPGYQSDLLSYLFGSILAVNREDIYLMGVILIIVIATIIKYYRDLLALSYDIEFAKLRGVDVKTLYVVMLALASLAIVMAIQVVGLIMVIALLSIPTYIAERLSKSLAQMMVISGVLATIFTLVGLFVSYTYNLTSGASIIFVASVSLGLYLFFDKLIKKGHIRRKF